MEIITNQQFVPKRKKRKKNSMKVSRNIHEFCQYNDTDMVKLMFKYYRNILARHPVEDIKNELYVKLIDKKYIENFRPLCIDVDVEKGIWDVKPSEAKFSTYIFTFIKNHILAYYGKKKSYEKWESLSDYNDSGYSIDGQKSLHLRDELNSPIEDDELTLDIQTLLKEIELREKNKGTIVTDTISAASIAKYIDSCGEKGSSLDEIKKLFFKGKISGIELLALDIALKTLIDNNTVKIENGIYLINTPERRNIYNLFKHYLNDMKDKDISKKFNMTVAGVGALKRVLREEIDILRDWSKKYGEDVSK